ncbi:MAG TPA: cyclopropane-fatty-acyl-phospholipid synthase family protein [Spongiibacteraceae bacterium]|nr:cyclopropane-fatty-acyl-phospholipid synthase family protein [Spongiibacteraceae bacterium]
MEPTISNSLKIGGVALDGVTATGIDKLAKKLVLQLLKKIRMGRLTLEDAGEIFEFGDGVDGSDLIAHISVHEVSAYRDILLRGSIGSGEAYMLGSWSSPDLTKVVRLIVANRHLMDDMDGRLLTPRKLVTALSRAGLRLFHALRNNSKSRAQRNIAAHYDLGNRFFELFLDPTMMYSAAIFPAPDSSLAEASLYKIDRICKQLQLQPGDHLLEIGTGWGGLALHAAQHYGCRVTTTTISREQYEYSKQRIAAAGYADRIELLLRDYRELEGQFDKLVSVEMIEAVGHAYYRAYFEKCASLLKPAGLMLIQAITIADQRYEAARRSVDFIQRYIFPGGCLPSIEVIARHLARYTDLNIVGIDDITQHYARTLQAWRERFVARIDDVRAQGFDEVFVRMWQFYLCYCEGGFRERSIGTQQILMAKPLCRIEPRLGIL